MTKVYRKRTHYICHIQNGVCGADPDAIPDCKNCDTYRRWKKSGKTIREWQFSGDGGY